MNPSFVHNRIITHIGKCAALAQKPLRLTISSKSPFRDQNKKCNWDEC